MQAKPVRSQGLIQFGIILLVLVTASIHLYLATEMWAIGMSGTLFLLNGLGYLGLLGALFLPLPFLDSFRPLVRIVFLLYTLITIAAWAVIGQRDAFGYIDKTVEVALVILLWIYRPGK